VSLSLGYFGCQKSPAEPCKNHQKSLLTLNSSFSARNLLPVISVAREARMAKIGQPLLRMSFVGDMGLKMGHLLPKDSHHVSHVNMLGGFNHLEK